MMSLLSTRSCVTACTSTIGDWPVTVTVSATVPTLSSTSIAAVNDPVSSIPSRLYGENPGSVTVTVYAPGLRSMMRYWPVPSVTAERTRSISAGLVASTVAPGNRAPLESLTTPVMDPCAIAVAGTNANARTNSFTNWRDVRIPWTPSVDARHHCVETSPDPESDARTVAAI